MRITMLGTTGSGKTCYMSAMSQLFYNGVVRGFHLKDHGGCSNDYLIHRTFNQINSIVTNRIWPDGTATSTIMQLELEHDGKHVVDIDWIDYKGKLVENIDNGIGQDLDAATLEAILLSSDVILVFIDAIILKVESNIYKIRDLTGANKIVRILQRVKKTKEDSNIIFLLSKVGSDLIDFHRDRWNITEKAKKVYDVFFSQMSEEAESCKFIPIDCLGFGKVQTHIITANGKNRYYSSIKDDMDPYNIDLSFAYALSKCIENVSLKKTMEKDLISCRIEELESEFGSIKQIFDILFHRSQRRKAIAVNKDRYQKYICDLGDLQKYKSELLTIWRGRI